MATVTLQIKETYTQTGYPPQVIPRPAVTITQAVRGRVDDEVTVAYHATDGAAIPFTNITTKGVTIIRNLDATNYIEIGSGTGTFVPILKIKPGEEFALRFLHAGTPTWRANVADCKARLTEYND